MELDNVQYKQEPASFTHADVIKAVCDFVHTKGQDSMERLLEANNADANAWPVSLKLDVLLKLLLNELGTVQQRVIDLEKEVKSKGVISGV